MIQNTLVSTEQYSLFSSLNSVERFTNLIFSELMTRTFESNDFYFLGLILKQDFTVELVDGKNIYKNMMYPDQCDRDDVNFNDTVFYFITEKIDDITKCIFKQFDLDFSLPHLLLQSDLSNWEDQYKIAQTCVENGLFVDAVNWFLKVVKQGYCLKECAYKFCYEEGVNEKKGLMLAVKGLYENGAKSGDLQAQWNLALCYSEGIGFDQDHVKECEWLSLAASQGLVNAKCRLALYYLNRNEVKQVKDNECLMEISEEDHKKFSKNKFPTNLVKRSRHCTTEETTSKIAKWD